MPKPKRRIIRVDGSGSRMGNSLLRASAALALKAMKSKRPVSVLDIRKVKAKNIHIVKPKRRR